MKSFDDTWEYIHSEQTWGKYPSETIIRFMARNYYEAKRKDVKVLDFGCGAGANTWYLAKEGFSVWAFDGSRAAIIKTQHLLEEYNLKNVNLKQMDALQLQYENKFFDVVIDSGTICANTLLNIKAMYKCIYKVLKVGGQLISTSYSTNTTGYGTGDLIEHNTYKNISEGPFAGGWVHHFFTEEEIEKILVEIGYQNVVIEKVITYEVNNRTEMLVVKASK